MSWLFLLGCTNASLYSATSQPNLANKASFQGDLCTEDPSDVSFEVRTLVVSDVSADMVSDDPAATRATAIQTLLQKFSAKNYTYGLIQYATTALALTNGFATDRMDLPPAIDSIRVATPDNQRSYLEPLRVATTAVQDDILGATPGERSRRRYVILFVVDGPPTPSLAGAWCPANGLAPNSAQCNATLAQTFCPFAVNPPDCELALYTKMVRDMRDYVLNQGAIDLQFHILSLKQDMRADALLQPMATAGRGAFIRQNPTQINFLAVDIATPAAILKRRELVVYNPNAIVRQGQLYADSDADGLTDEEEVQLGTDPTKVDTDGDSVGDQIERAVGTPGSMFDPLTAALPTECMLLTDPHADLDGDGLNDCEEVVLRTEPSLPDTDKDGIPDLIEVHRGGNPLVDDALSDTDSDGLTNGEELRGGLEVSSSDAQSELDYGYRYRFFDEGPETRLEVRPREPIPGVVVSRVDGGQDGVGHFAFVPPATLTYSNDVFDPVFGPPVNLSAGGELMVTAPNGQTLQLVVTAEGLPTDPQQVSAQVRQTRRSCFRYDVRNITLVETQEIPGGRPGRGWNDIRVYMAQLSEETPNGYGIFSVASVPMRYLAPNQKSPNQAFLDLPQAAFVLIGGGVQ